MTIEEFITKWQGLPGGAERANFQPFIGEFCRVLGLPEPAPATGGVLSDYRFEAPVKHDPAWSDQTSGAIDLYKKHCFVLEAKQSRLKEGEKAPANDLPAPQPERIVSTDLFGNQIVSERQAPRPKGRRYDRLMEDALAQAKRYALALPPDHGWPPFIIVCDVGRAFELYFDWAGNGKAYGFFPDQKRYRIELADLRDCDIRKLLTGIWTDPPSVDPRRQTVTVTNEIAARLARVSRTLESDRRATMRSHDDATLSRGIEETSLFLMRMLFCMFAEDVDLLPEKAFQTFLADSIGKSDQYWRSGLNDLWSRMNDPNAANRYWSFGDTVVRYFNGNLFSEFRIFDLPREEKGELLAAARTQWRDVEPAIFGTLLEQALTPAQRASLGAHYTPRPYVERLVQATIIDALLPEWQAVREPDGGTGPDLAAVLAFHDRLATLRVLDPACGTGNFLYVAMEQLLRLESDVLVLIAQLGGTVAPRIGPNQFLGLEINPRAAVIAELVLWIGWLRFRLTNDPASIGEPVLPPLSNINFGGHGGYDALLAADPVTGARADLANPRPAAWPEADFIVGNPPFIGKGSAMRAALGDDYVEAVWQAWPQVAASADFVMQWWDRAAADLLRPGTRLRRFGLVTTNSITQSFSRRVVAARLAPPLPHAGEARDAAGGPGEGVLAPVPAETPSPAALTRESPLPPAGEGQGLSLVLAIPDHPWTKASRDAAAVRIAMTVAERGQRPGCLIEIVGEAGLDTDAPALTERRSDGTINSDLSVGTDVTSAVALRANEGLSCNGMMLAGQGFKLSAAEAALLLSQDGEAARSVIRPYVGGGELLSRPQGRFVIDLCGWAETDARRQLPAIYQHLLRVVKTERDVNNRKAFRDRWWIFGEPRKTFRPTLVHIKRFIGTTETSKHRIFQFIDVATVPDHMVVAIASEDAFHLGVLSSQIHTEWCLVAGGWLGYGNDNRYTKSRVFDPFPFPNATSAQRAAIATLAEELDLTRRVALDENPGLTMTGLYNLVAPIRAGAALTAGQEGEATRARARIIAKLHGDLDSAVAAAYGWPADLPAAAIVARLVALNRERAAEEAAGTVRWLRPDYQAPAATT